MLTRDRVRGFISESFLVEEFADDDSFLASGIIDSLGVMQLVAFIEFNFGISVSDADLVPENFDSVERLAAFIERRLRGA